MESPPTLETARLVLRPLREADAADVRRLAGDRAIADTTLLIPHPYPEGAAEEWIAGQPEDWAKRRGVVFALTDREGGALLGAMGLVLNLPHRKAELGYWVARDRWGRGYATEAARAVIAWAFDGLGLHRVEAHHMVRNPASGRVLEKAGMTREGLCRAFHRKGERFEDAVLYGVLASDPRPA